MARPTDEPGQIDGGHSVPVMVRPDGVDVHPRRIGHKVFDILLAGSAILISCISLYVAVEESKRMQELVAANSWPLLQIRTANSVDDQPVIRFTVENAGVGPALIKSFDVDYRGQRTSNLERIVQICCGTFPQTQGKVEPGNLGTNFVANTVIRAGDDLPILVLPKAPKNASVWEQLNTKRFKMKFHACYCSVFGTCWESDLTGVNPTEVEQCPPAEATTPR